MDQLEKLIITFIVIVVISLIGLVALLVIRDERKNRIIFYTLGAWGMILAWIFVLGLEYYQIGAQMLVWFCGSLSPIAMLVEMTSRHKKKFLITRALIAISVLGNTVGIFMD